AFAPAQLEPGRARIGNDLLWVDALGHTRPWPAAVLLEIHDANRARPFERACNIAEQRDRLLDLMICVDDQHRIERSRRQLWIDWRAKHRPHILQSLALHPALNRLDHLRLDVFRVNPTVGPDRAGEPHREPAAAGAEIGDAAAFADEERVHDLVRTLPGIAVRSFEL